MACQQEAEAAMADYGLPFETGLEEDGSPAACHYYKYKYEY
jgi:hypothetical protein